MFGVKSKQLLLDCCLHYYAYFIETTVIKLTSVAQSCTDIVTQDHYKTAKL